MSEKIPPKVFISYSHDTPEHAERVLGLSDCLRRDGIDSHIDQYEVSPAEGWPRWMLKRVKWADFVLVVCTATYNQRFTGEAPVGQGKGVKWEGAILTQELYDAEAQNTRFIPVALSSQDTGHIPGILRGQTYYDTSTDKGYENLYRHLTNQPRTLKPVLGKLKSMSPLERKQNFSIPPFPFKDWTEVNNANWHDRIIKWFDHDQAYRLNPEGAMEMLLDHLFKIIENAQIVFPSNLPEYIMKIGEDLISHLPSDLESKDTYEHHKRILELLKLGIHYRLPHLFILPQANKDYLLAIPDYSRLLLSARYFLLGEFENTKKLLKKITEGCSIARSILSQIEQKRGNIFDAKNLIEKNRLFLQERLESHRCCCSKEMKVICDGAQLKAENNRALGVVWYELGDINKAEEYFNKATEFADDVYNKLRRSTANISTKNDKRPYGIAADIYYSYGYYWFQQKEYTKAEKLFEQSIEILNKTLDKIDENWHAPYVRLSIVKLLLNNKVDDSRELFLRAKEICRKNITKDREASIDLALCILGLRIIVGLIFFKWVDMTPWPTSVKDLWLKVIEDIITTQTDWFKLIRSFTPPPAELSFIEHFVLIDPIEKLEEALKIQPSLSQLPLKYRRNEVERIIKYCEEKKIPVPKIVNNFIEKL